MNFFSTILNSFRSIAVFCLPGYEKKTIRLNFVLLIPEFLKIDSFNRFFCSHPFVLFSCLFIFHIFLRSIKKKDCFQAWKCWFLWWSTVKLFLSPISDISLVLLFLSKLVKWFYIVLISESNVKLSTILESPKSSSYVELPYTQAIKSVQTILVKPKTPGPSTDTKLDLCSVMNPTDFNLQVCNIKQTRDGSVVLECSRFDDFNLMKERLKRNYPKIMKCTYVNRPILKFELLEWQNFVVILYFCLNQNYR